MKAASGKFHPIYQWFLFDSMESLPGNLPLPPDEVSLLVCCPIPGIDACLGQACHLDAVFFSCSQA